VPEDEQDTRKYWLIIFFSLIALLPHLRLIWLFRFYLTVLVKSFFRVLPGFVLLMWSIYIWSAALYQMKNDGGDGTTKWYSSNTALKESYGFSWGEDPSGWLGDFLSAGTVSVKPVITLLWLLLAHVVYFNIMIAIVGDVYGATKGSWTQGELEMKNEFVVMTEKLLFWRRCTKKCIFENNARRHLIFV
jgi:hypothetical protein